jgi:putative serine protease PepD
MTESNDPFAAQPYVPPTDRGRAEEPTTENDQVDQDHVDQAHADQERGDHDLADQQPVAHHEGPTTEQNRVDPDATPTEQVPHLEHEDPSSAPAPADYSHRYADHGGPVGSGAGDPASTQTLPPFAAPAGTPGSGGTGTDGPRRRRGRTLAGVVAMAVLAGGAGFGGAWAYDQTQDDGGSSNGVVSSLDDSSKATQTKAPDGSVRAVAQKVLPSVVQINVKGQSESGSGTGIIISSDGQILTNNHVVEVAADGGTITVAFNDGTNTKATIVGRDAKTDLAVVKAQGKTGLTAATLGTSADLQVGQEVVAIGSPFGLESTVTEGIISALNRPVSSSDGSGSSQSTTFPAVQTDAAINPGNSGGPLVDLDGRVIAINSAIRSGTTTSGDAGSIGLGFAIPIDLAKNVAKQLVDGKTVEHAQIGVSVDNFLSDDGITGIGAQVKEVVSGGAGDKAGIKTGDVITAVNGALIPSSEALVASVRGYNPGEKITISYTRGGKKATTEVTLDSDGGKTS